MSEIYAYSPGEIINSEGKNGRERVTVSFSCGYTHNTRETGRKEEGHQYPFTEHRIYTHSNTNIRIYSCNIEEQETTTQTEASSLNTHTRRIYTPVVLESSSS